MDDAAPRERRALQRTLRAMSETLAELPAGSIYAAPVNRFRDALIMNLEPVVGDPQPQPPSPEPR